MNNLNSEVLVSQRYEALVADLKNRVPYDFESDFTEEDLEFANFFIHNPHGSFDPMSVNYLPLEFAFKLKELQETPLFSELQEAAREHLAHGYTSRICLQEAFYFTIHDPSLPQLKSLKEKYEKNDAFKNIKEFLKDLREGILVDEEVKKIYFDYLIRSVPGGSYNWYGREDAVEFLNRQTSGKEQYLIGDFGCGIGDWTNELRKQLGDVAIIYASDQQYHKGVPDFKWSPKKGLTFFRADFRNIPLADDSLDCALMGFVIPHITENLAAQGLREVERVLKEGGCLVVGPTDKKDELNTGWAVLRKKDGVLIESEDEFIVC